MVDVRLQSLTLFLFYIYEVCQRDSGIPSRLEILEERSTQLLPTGDQSSKDGP